MPARLKFDLIARNAPQNCPYDTSRLMIAVLADCEVASVLLPDDLSVLALKVLELVGNHSLDPVYLARHALKLCTRVPAVQSLGLACFAYSLDRGDAEAIQQRLNMVLINAPTADG